MTSRAFVAFLLVGCASSAQVSSTSETSTAYRSQTAHEGASLDPMVERRLPRDDTQEGLVLELGHGLRSPDGNSLSERLRVALDADAPHMRLEMSSHQDSVRPAQGPRRGSPLTLIAIDDSQKIRTQWFRWSLSDLPGSELDPITEGALREAVLPLFAP